jgi:hypothetical protein
MKTITILFLTLFTQLSLTSTTYCDFINLGRTYTVPQGSTYNQTPQPTFPYFQDRLVGTLNVEGTYNIIGDGGFFSPTLYVNNLNISGSFNNYGGQIVNSSGWYYNNFDIVVSPTGSYSQTAGSMMPYTSMASITNQGTFRVSGGSVFTPVFDNAGTLTIGASGRFGTGRLSNTGIINANRSFGVSDITNLNISNGVVTDIRGKAGMVIHYPDTAANDYLGHNDYLLSGQGGLLTHFADVISVTTDSPYSLTINGSYHLGFDFWWDTGINTLPPQPGYDLDVLARLDGGEWQSIAQISANTSSTGWNPALFSLPPDLRDAGTQIKFVLTDQPPGTNRAIYLRAFATPDTGGTALMLVISLAAIFFFWHWERWRRDSSSSAPL